MRAYSVFLLAATAAAATPQFSSSWSAYVAQDLVQNQGSYELANGDLCCNSDANDCQIQVQSQAGMLYWSFPTNQTSNVFGVQYQPYAIIDDYNLGMEMAVDSTFTCQSYCPIQGPMDPFNVVGYTDMGATNILGQQVELWQDVDVFPGLNITMETDNLYINQSNMSNAFPILDVDTLTPFGEYLGQSNTTYTNFQAGPQNPKWFTVKGASTCQMSSSCNSDSIRQLHRLTVGRKAEFFRAHFAAKAEQLAVEARSAGMIAEAIAHRG